MTGEACATKTVQHKHRDKEVETETGSFAISRIFLPEALSQYRTYEDAFFNKVKDGLLTAKEYPALGAGLAISAALLAMRGAPSSPP
ncbi:hypothetical protein Fmac_015226 [Flemingia macrophylla]|uniref:Uncharacterized protein n=1 Tax=Flemingia macrophylla TaxID=520843 RepID=A0ABD1MDZ0_9FABA